MKKDLLEILSHLENPQYRAIEDEVRNCGTIDELRVTAEKILTLYKKLEKPATASAADQNLVAMTPVPLDQCGKSPPWGDPIYIDPQKLGYTVFSYETSLEFRARRRFLQAINKLFMMGFEEDAKRLKALYDAGGIKVERIGT